MSNKFSKYSENLAGVWKLLSYDLYDTDGPDKKLLGTPYGNEPMGRIVISSSGYISALVVSPASMEPFSVEELVKAPDDELLRVARGISAYAGFMHLIEREDGGLKWFTTIETANTPNWVGKQQIREADWYEENGVAYMILKPVKWIYLQVCISVQLFISTWTVVLKYC